MADLVFEFAGVIGAFPLGGPVADRVVDVGEDGEGVGPGDEAGDSAR